MPAPTNLNAGQLDQTQILQRAFDESTDKLRVDSSVSINSITGEVNVELNAADGDNVALSDGTNTVTTTINGSNVGLDVNIINDLLTVTTSSPGTYKSYYSENNSIPQSVLTTILSYTIPISITGFLQKCIVSGTNIATYTVLINSSIIDKKRTMHGGNLNEEFNFSSYGMVGYPISSGDIVQVKVIHERSGLGDFNARLQVVEE